MDKIIALLLCLALHLTGQSFAVSPSVSEFNSGIVKKFSSLGHPESKGINMEMSYPDSWLAQDGVRPNILQEFFSENGEGLEGAILITKTLPLPEGTIIPESELKQFFTEEGMRSTVPPGGKYLGGKSTRIEGIPAGIIEYSMRQERLGLVIDSHYISFVFIYNNTMVMLQCMVSNGETMTSTDLADKMKEFRPLFYLMANSIVLSDRWK